MVWDDPGASLENLERERETEKDRERQTDRQTEMEGER